MELMDGLNESQRAAVTATEGCIRVLAGAGSGKTRALSRRFAFLVREIGVLPSNILCVTFTNKAANEMRLRIRQLTGDDDTGYICTFHSFCVSVLHEDAHAVQYPENFLVLDNADIDAILALIYEERGITLRQMTFKAARDMFELRKGRDEPEYYEDMIAMPLDILRQKYLQAEKLEDILFYGYLYQEKKCFGLDYNDLIKFTLHIFTENPAIRTKWQKRLEYIMVDEFQDIDKLQYKLLRVLYGYHKNLFLVGDPDQTIYSWRGANVRYLLEFPDKFPGTRTIFMMQNYRSTPEILAVANSLIAKNKNRVEKNLSPIKAAGTKPLVFHARDSREEAEWIADRIQTMVKAGQKLSEIAVLYRAHYVTYWKRYCKRNPCLIHCTAAYSFTIEARSRMHFLICVCWHSMMICLLHVLSISQNATLAISVCDSCAIMPRKGIACSMMPCGKIWSCRFSKVRRPHSLSVSSKIFLSNTAA